MSITIHAEINIVAFAGAKRVVNSKDEIAALVSALSEVDCDIKFADDVQLGFLANRVDPARVADLLLGMSEETQAKNKDLVAFAVAQNRALFLTTATDEAYMEGQPRIELSDDDYREPQLNCSHGRAWTILGDLGLPVDPEDYSFSTSASELLAALEGPDAWRVGDNMRVRLFDIANFAIKKNGPEARVIAA